MRLFPMATAAVMATLLAGCATTGGESLQCSLGRMMGQPCEATVQPAAGTVYSWRLMRKLSKHVLPSKKQLPAAPACPRASALRQVQLTPSMC